MPDTRYLPVLAAIRQSEDATRTAIRHSWPSATDIHYRRLADETLDYVSWRADGTQYLAGVGLETATDWALAIGFWADMIEMGHHIVAPRNLIAQGNEIIAAANTFPITAPVVLIGHSYGASVMAILGAIRGAHGLGDRTTVVMFGAPRCLNETGRRFLARCTVTNYQITSDPVVALPPAGWGSGDWDHRYVSLPATVLPNVYLAGDPRNHYISSYLRSLTMPSVIIYPSQSDFQDFTTWRRYQMTTDEYRRWFDGRNTVPFNIGGPSTDEYRCAEAISSATSWFDLFQRLQHALGQVDNFGMTLVRIGPAPQDCRRMLDRVRVQVMLGDRLATQALAADFTTSLSSGVTADWGGDEPAAMVPFTGQATLPDYMGRTLERFANMGGQAGAAIAAAPSQRITSDTSQIRLFNFEGTFIVTVGDNVVYVSQSESAATNQLGRWRQSLRLGTLAQQLADTIEYTDFPYEVSNGTIVRIQGR